MLFFSTFETSLWKIDYTFIIWNSVQQYALFPPFSWAGNERLSTYCIVMCEQFKLFETLKVTGRMRTLGRKLPMPGISDVVIFAPFKNFQ